MDARDATSKGKLVSDGKSMKGRANIAGKQVDGTIMEARRKLDGTRMGAGRKIDAGKTPWGGSQMTATWQSARKSMNGKRREENGLDKNGSRKENR